MIRSEFVVLANRTDGLGQRLKAILNAYYLAKRLGVKFKFCWKSEKSSQKFHAISTVHDIFSEEFIRNHFVNESSLDLGRYLDLSKKKNKLSEDYDLEVFRKRNIHGFICQPHNLRGMIAEALLPQSDFNLSHAFQEIEFSDDLRRIASIVSQLELSSESIAIHLRGGDIIYAQYRFYQYFQKKVIPLALAKRFISDFNLKNKPVVLFIQDESLYDVFRSIPGAILAADLVDSSNYSNLEQTFFDFLLMGRCSKIIAAPSGFAELSARISDQDIKKPERFFSNKEIMQVIKQDLDDSPGYDDLQLAFAWLMYTIYGESYLSFQEINEALINAQALDSLNHLYIMKRVINYLSFGKIEEAEFLVAEFFEKAGHEDSPLKLGFLYALCPGRDGSLRVREYCDLFKAVDDVSKPYLLFCRAYILFVTKEYEDYKDVLELLTIQKNSGLGLQAAVKALESKIARK